MDTNSSKAGAVAEKSRTDDAEPFHTFRFLEAEGKPHATVIELLSGSRSGDVVHRFLATRETLERFAKAMADKAAAMSHSPAGLA